MAVLPQIGLDGTRTDYLGLFITAKFPLACWFCIIATTGRAFALTTYFWERIKQTVTIAFQRVGPIRFVASTTPTLVCLVTM